MPDLHTGWEHTSASLAAGFVDVRLDDVWRHVAPSVTRLLFITLLALPANLIRRLLGIRSAVQHGNTMSVFSLVALLVAGGASYGILSAAKRS